jgi:hypothetical protein
MKTARLFAAYARTCFFAFTGAKPFNDPYASSAALSFRFGAGYASSKASNASRWFPIDAVNVAYCCK